VLGFEPEVIPSYHNQMGTQAKASFISKAIWTLRHRPLLFWQLARGYLLFSISHWLSKLLFSGSSGVTLGKNVRLQRCRSLLTERPHAQISVGNHCIIYENARIEAYGGGSIAIGSSSVLGDVRIYSKKSVKLGERLITSWNVFIQDYDPHPLDPEKRANQLMRICQEFRPSYLSQNERVSFPADPETSSDEIVIGNDVWLGAGCVILKGARIGHGSIVAAGAVVTAGNYPDRSVLAGNPAKVVKAL
jgi:acetyltransferase-like isoleucine patch superfamily enzyme